MNNANDKLNKEQIDEVRRMVKYILEDEVANDADIVESYTETFISILNGKSYWTKVSKELPDEDQNVLLFYRKGLPSTHKDNKRNGFFVTEGYLKDSVRVVDGQEVSEGLAFFDYAGRKLQSLSAVNSKNMVLCWQPFWQPMLMRPHLSMLSNSDKSQA